MSVTQTSWDNVSKVNIFASGFCVGCAMFAPSTLMLGISLLGAVTCWAAAHITPPPNG